MFFGALAACVLVYLVLRWFRITLAHGACGNIVDKRDNALALSLLGCLESPDIEDEGPNADVVAKKPGDFPKIVVIMARAAKAEFGLLKRTEANRLVVQKFIRDAMRDRNMRPTHIAWYLPLAVEAAFIPTRYDILAKKIAATDAVAEIEARNGPWFRVVDQCFGFVRAVQPGLAFSGR